MENIESIINIITSFGTIGAIIFAVYQFRNSQKWQKAELLLNLIDRFDNDEVINRAKDMLDWDKKKIKISESEFIDFENKNLLNALAIVEWDDDSFTPQERIIRDSFDTFFDYFHKLFSLQKSGLLKFKDFNYFYYYFELINNVSDYKGGDEYEIVLNNYIDSYSFIGIKSLLKQYKKNPQPLNIMSNEEIE